MDYKSNFYYGDAVGKCQSEKSQHLNRNTREHCSRVAEFFQKSGTCDKTENGDNGSRYIEAVDTALAHQGAEVRGVYINGQAVVNGEQKTGEV